MMRIFSNSVVRARSRSSALLDHKELCQLADEIVRLAKLSYEKTASLQLFAMTLGDEGKISQFTSGLERDVRSLQEACRVLESGLCLMARQGNCKAVGLCPEIHNENPAVEPTETVIFIEHRDGSAYRIRFSRMEPQKLRVVRAEPRVFLSVGRKSRVVGSSAF
jgi:hypothetical protein